MPAQPSLIKRFLPAVLFLATVITTTAAGALFLHPDRIEPIRDGLPFSIPLLAILLCHEFGHYFTARRHGVAASLPHFIPLPPFIGFVGTMGAVINMKAVTSDRRKLIDIGAAGPLAGLVVAIPVLLYGLHLSPVDVVRAGGMQEGNSLLYAGLKYLVKGRWLPGGGSDVQLHPTAFAGWVGLLVTMLNLMPVGQLDGGHIATAYFGNRWAAMAKRVQSGLIVLALGSFAWVYLLVSRYVAAGGKLPEGNTPTLVALAPAMNWMFWWMLLRFIHWLSGGVAHPPVDDTVALPRSRRVLFWVVATAFLLIFMPVTLRMSLGAVDGAHVMATGIAAALP